MIIGQSPEWRMNTIHAVMHQSKHTRAPHPVFTIDGVPLASWVKGVIYDAAGADISDGLVPAQGWLIDDDHLRYAWQMLEPQIEDSSTIVPLLICSDDMDLSCTVAVVEQVVRAEHLIWERFGRAVGVTSGVVTSVAWIESQQRAEFDKDEFQEACAEFKRLTEHAWA
jgi:hypothetical protein